MLLSVLNWLLVGIFSDVLDLFYLESWQVFLTCGLSSSASARLGMEVDTLTIRYCHLLGSFECLIGRIPVSTEYRLAG